MELQQLRLTLSISQKKGIHFILSSIVIWTFICILHLRVEQVELQNFYTFMITSFLLPFAYLISKPFKITFHDERNPLSKLGFLLSLNQLLYILIAMWVYNQSPEHFIMVMAMIFGAHLLPFGWLYMSRAYHLFAICIPLVSLYLGITSDPLVIPIVMIGCMIGFALLLGLEVKHISTTAPATN